MSKGLEILKTIRHIHDMECGKDERIDKDFDIIEKELKEYEQHKIIEQELGIDLVTLVKTLKNGCFVKPWKEIKYTYEIRTGSDNINLFLLDENDNDYSLKDYGKTWALTREELEK